MAVKIPLYNQQTTAEGFAQANARNELAVDQTGAALEKFGNATAHLAGVGAHFIAEKENADAIANASDMWANKQKDFLIFQKESYDQALKNNDVDGFAGKIDKEFSKFSRETLANTPNEKARTFLQQQMDHFGLNLFNSSMNMEAKGALGIRDTQITNAAGVYNQLVSTGQMDFDTAHNAIKTMIANVNYDPESRMQKYNQLTGGLAESALNREMILNPGAVKSQMEHVYGMSNQQSSNSANAESQLPTRISASSMKAVERFGPVIDQASAQTGVDATFLRRQLAAESSGNPEAINNADKNVTGSPSIGIAQFQPGTAKRYGIDPTKPDQAINGQARYMADLLKMFDGDYSKAAAGYNWGEGNVQKAVDKYGDKWRDHIPASTQDYLNKIGTPSGDAKTGQAPVNAGFASVLRNIPANKWDTVYHQATTADNQQRALKAATLNDQVRDSHARAMGGYVDQKPLTEIQFVEALGPEHGPAQYKVYADTQRVGNMISQLATASPEQAKAMFDQRDSLDINAPNYAETSQNTDEMKKAWARVIEMRKADPASYTLKFSQSVQGAYAGMNQAISTNNPDQIRVASNAFATATLAEQNRLGIKDPAILPKDYADSIVKQFYNQTNGADKSVQLMEQLSSQWGSNWNSVFGQIQKDLPPIARVVGSFGPTVNPAVKEIIVSTAKMKPDELKAGIPSDMTKTMSDSLTTAFGDLKKTMSYQSGGLQTFNILYDSAERLGFYYMSTGMAPTDAATKAYGELIGKQYNITGSARIPVQYDSSAVMKGADIVMSDLDNQNIVPNVATPKGMPAKDANKQYIDALKNGAGVWLTDGQEKGLILYDAVSMSPVKRSNGSDFRIDWDHLINRSVDKSRNPMNYGSDWGN